MITPVEAESSSFHVLSTGGDAPRDRGEHGPPPPPVAKPCEWRRRLASQEPHPLLSVGVRRLLDSEHTFEGSKSGVDPVREHDRIVRPIDTPRLTAATRGVSQRMGDVLNRAGAQWEPRLLANLYAAAALGAADAHGEEHDLITQHYWILKRDLVIVNDLAAASIVGRHGGSAEHGDCPGCLQSLALGRVRSAIEWTSAPGWDQTSPGSA
jgi:hypothetical protein